MNDNNSQSIDAAQDLASALHKNRLHMQATNIFLALDPHTAQDDSTLHAWEQLARRALQFSQHGKIESAMALQINALQVAARLLAGPMLYAHPDRCMAAWVVSHHNVAQLLEQRQQLVLALDYLCDAHIGLRSIQSAPATAPEVQQAALRHTLPCCSGTPATVAAPALMPFCVLPSPGNLTVLALHPRHQAFVSPPAICTDGHAL